MGDVMIDGNFLYAGLGFAVVLLLFTFRSGTTDLLYNVQTHWKQAIFVLAVLAGTAYAVYRALPGLI